MASAVETGKKAAAFRAVDENISADHKVVGIGSGSTVIYAVERILQRPELHHIVYVPTSFQSLQLITDGGLKLGSVEQYVKRNQVLSVSALALTMLIDSLKLTLLLMVPTKSTSN
ncbi:ribose-5-phosphate isomerase rki1 [Umbelopsis sp. WA50703]